MSFANLFHSFDFPQRAGLARQLLLAGAALLLAGSVLAQTPAKGTKNSAPRIVSDDVKLAGSKITGGWRETAANGSWRRVEFVVDGDAGSVTFGDGEKGRRPPGVSRYTYAGPGTKGGKETYTEERSFAGASPALLARANRSSPTPKGVATRIRELGGDFRQLQRLMDESHRMKEIGSAFDAARKPSDDGKFFGGRPGGSPGEGKWSNPRAGVGRDGRAGDDVVIYRKGGTDAEGNYESKVITRHTDGSTTEGRTWVDADGSSGSGTTERDASGNVTGGYNLAVSANGDSREASFTRDPKTGVIEYHTRESIDNGYEVRHRSRHGGTPPETGSSRGFDEAWLYESAPWLMDALYTNWKRGNDLLVSGGRIAQPGRGDGPSQAPAERPRVGANAVVNCGDSNTNPCAGAESANTDRDSRERLGALTQPPRDGLSGGPLGGTGGPLGGGGVPLPPPNPQFQK